MGGKGSSAPVATNDQIVAMQQQQAAQATEANRQRNARLQYGTQNIKDIFEGHPGGGSYLDVSAIGKPQAAVPGTTTRTPAPGNTSQQYTYSPNPAGDVRGGPGTVLQTPNPSYNPAAASGYVTTTTGGSPANAGTSGSLAGGYSWKALPDDGSGTPQYGLLDSSGNLVDSGSLSDLSASKIYTGGSGATEGGFGPDFYDKYTNSILDYYLPQEGQQYNTARSSLSYSLARAGQLNSSTAGTDIANLSNQDAINRAQIASGADTQTGALRSTIQQDEQSALNQLYSTEDPSVAANTAQNMVANAQLTKPILNPAGALFAPISVGVGNALSGFTNPLAYINPSAGGVGSTGAATPGIGVDASQTKQG